MAPANPTLIKSSAAHHARRWHLGWQGKPVAIGSRNDAQALGIATVFQDLALCDNLTWSQPVSWARAGSGGSARRDRHGEAATDLLRTLS